jgi:hypothetical protein
MIIYDINYDKKYDIMIILVVQTYDIIVHDIAYDMKYDISRYDISMYYDYYDDITDSSGILTT